MKWSHDCCFLSLRGEVVRSCNCLGLCLYVGVCYCDRVVDEVEVGLSVFVSGEG